MNLLVSCIEIPFNRPSDAAGPRTRVRMRASCARSSAVCGFPQSGISVFWYSGIERILAESFGRNNVRFNRNVSVSFLRLSTAA